MSSEYKYISGESPRHGDVISRLEKKDSLEEGRCYTVDRLVRGGSDVVRWVGLVEAQGLDYFPSGFELVRRADWASVPEKPDNLNRLENPDSSIAARIERCTISQDAREDTGDRDLIDMCNLALSWRIERDQLKSECDAQNALLTEKINKTASLRQRIESLRLQEEEARNQREQEYTALRRRGIKFCKMNGVLEAMDLRDDDDCNSLKSSNGSQQQEPKRGDVQRYAWGRIGMIGCEDGPFIDCNDHAAKVAELEKYADELDNLGSLIGPAIAIGNVKAIGRREVYDAVAVLIQERDDLRKQLAIRDRDANAELDRIRDATDRIAKVFGEQVGHGLPIDGPGGCVQWVLTKLAEAKVEIERLMDEQLKLARDYDPNCDDFDFAYQREVMKSAFRIIEAAQSMAQSLGRDPEGCLVTACECAVEVIDERDMLKQELKDSQSQLAAERAKRERIVMAIKSYLDGAQGSRHVLSKALADDAI